MHTVVSFSSMQMETPMLFQHSIILFTWYDFLHMNTHADVGSVLYIYIHTYICNYMYIYIYVHICMHTFWDGWCNWHRFDSRKKHNIRQFCMILAMVTLIAVEDEVRFNHPQTIMHPSLAFSLDLLWEKLVPCLQRAITIYHRLSVDCSFESWYVASQGNVSGIYMY